MSATTCDLCGQHDDQVRVQLAWFRDPRGPVTPIPRWDHDACRARVIAAGDDWPLTDSSEEVWHRLEKQPGFNERLDRGMAQITGGNVLPMPEPAEPEASAVVRESRPWFE